MVKLLYIGSGLDFTHVIHFSQVREFVFIDTQLISVFYGIIMIVVYFLMDFINTNLLIYWLKMLTNAGFGNR